MRVQREDFDVGAELDALTRDRRDIGAVTSFVGLVRDIAGDAKIGAMTLEHYPGMTEKELARVEAEAHARWQLSATPHREQAFEACHFLIDWLKTSAPFWKLEDTDKGPQWVDAKSTDDAAAARWNKPQ